MLTSSPQILLAIFCLLCQCIVYTQQRSSVGQLMIRLPDQNVAEFFYLPTIKGYRFSYILNDGVKRQEISVIPKSEILTNCDDNNNNQPLGKDLAGRLDTLSHMFNMLDRNKFRNGQKNRKLSPKSLQSLAG